jgi:hypothetical protein
MPSGIIKIEFVLSSQLRAHKKAEAIGGLLPAKEVWRLSAYGDGICN